MDLQLKSSQGFTVIELMLAVAILSILAGISLPHFTDQITYAHEAATKGNLGAIRSALSVYYGDNDGKFPTDITVLATASKYIASIPYAYLPPYYVDGGGGGGPGGGGGGPGGP